MPAPQLNYYVGLAQLLGYVTSLALCCVSVSLGTCSLAAGSFGAWHNTLNPWRCGEFLVWGCLTGVAIYIWFPSRVELIAAVVVLAVVFGPEISAAIAAVLASAGAAGLAAAGALGAGLVRLLGPLLGGGGRLVPGW